MAALKHKGINHLDLSLVARLVLENLVARLLKGDSDEYLVTAYDLAEEFGISRESVRESFLELIEQGYLNSDGDSHGLPSSVRLSRVLVSAELFAKDEQPKLGDEGPIPKTREDTGEDRAEFGDRHYRATVQAGGEKGFLLNVDMIGCDSATAVGGYDPFGEDTPKVVDMEFGSSDEAWAWWDEYCGNPNVFPAHSWTTSMPGAEVDASAFSMRVQVKPDGEHILLVVEVAGAPLPFKHVLDAFIAGTEGTSYICSEAGTYFAGTDADFTQMGYDITTALNYVQEFALARATPPAAVDKPKNSDEAAKPKKGRKTKAEPA